MNEIKPKFEAHVFICTKCTYPVEPGEISSPENAVEFCKSVKTKALDLWDKNEVRVNASGCLGQCERGISCAIYPQNRWPLELRPGLENDVINTLKELLKRPE
jgi:predicted metal-binding protein